MGVADRLRELRKQMEYPTETATEVSTEPPASSLPPTLPLHRPLENGARSITLPTLPTDDALAHVRAGDTLAERTVRFFSLMGENMPGGSNPVMAVLVRQLRPHLVRELSQLDEAALTEVYKAMVVSLLQVYNPDAAHVQVDLTQGHVLIDDVRAATGRDPVRPYIPLEDAEMPATAGLPAAQPLALPEHPPAAEMILEAEPQPVVPEQGPALAPAPPAPPEAVAADDDPLVGIEVPQPDGSVKVYAVRQSQAKLLRGQ